MARLSTVWHARRTSFFSRSRGLPADIEHQHISSDAGAKETSNARTNRAEYLDGLRGLAALLVFLHHTTPDFTRGEHEHGFGQDGVYWHLTSLPFIRLIWNGGNAAVPVFFMISGYVLSIAPLQKLHDDKGPEVRRGLIEAAVKRPFRLFAPAFAITLLQVILLHVRGLCINDPGMPPFPRDNLLDEVDSFVADLTYFDPFRNTEDSPRFPYNGVMWTLPIELRGSLFLYSCMLVLSVGGLAGARVKAATAMASSILVGAAIVLQTTSDWSTVCFAWGMALAMCDIWPVESCLHDCVQHIFKKCRTATLQTWSSKAMRPQRHRWSLLPIKTQMFAHVCFFAGCYLLSEPGYPHYRWYSSNTPGWRWLTQLIPSAYDDTHFHRYWTTIGSLPFLYAVLRTRWVQTFFSSKPLKFLGRISFALYLIHLPWNRIFTDRIKSFVGGYTNPALEGSFWGHRVDISDMGPPGLSPRFLVAMTVILPSIMFSAWLVTVTIDEPSVRMSKWIAKKMGIGRR